MDRFVNTRAELQKGRRLVSDNVAYAWGAYSLISPICQSLCLLITAREHLQCKPVYASHTVACTCERSAGTATPCTCFPSQSSLTFVLTTFLMAEFRLLAHWEASPQKQSQFPHRFGLLTNHCLLRPSYSSYFSCARPASSVARRLW